jgi:hypothetical protein
MDEWEVDLEESLVGMFWWNLKPYIKTLSHIEKKQNILVFIMCKVGKLKLGLKSTQDFKGKMSYVK